MEEFFEKAIRNTEILKMPKCKISTFGTTNIDYYILSSSDDKTRIRDGKVISRRPEIIRPAQISELFEGFEDFAEKYGEELFEAFGKDIKILNYKFKNQPNSTTESSSTISEVYEKLKEQLGESRHNMSAIIRADEATWQISIMKFIVEITLKSAGGNIMDFEERSMFADERGIPQNIRNKIDYLFEKAKSDSMKREELGKLLTDYKLFKEYEDRFFGLYRN
jgi:hypothetical protein